MHEPKEEFRITPQGDKVRIEIPAQYGPMLSNWVGRIQQEEDLPVELNDVAFATVTNLDQGVQRAKRRGKRGAFFSWDQLYERVKADAIKVFKARRARLDDGSSLGGNA